MLHALPKVDLKLLAIFVESMIVSIRQELGPSENWFYHVLLFCVLFLFCFTHSLTRSLSLSISLAVTFD